MKRNHSSASRTWCAKPGLRSLGLLLILTLLIGGAAIGTNAAVIQLNPIEDSFVESSAPAVNYGGTGGLYVGDAQPTAPGSIARSYLKFDLSALPAGAVIDTARLYLYNTVMYYPAIDIGAHFLPNDTWTEMGITWTNAPVGFNAVPTALTTINMTVWTAWDVTPDVQTEWAGDGVYSVVMKEPAAGEGAGGNYVLFNSREDPQPTDRPYLWIEYTQASPVDETTWSNIKIMFK